MFMLTRKTVNLYKPSIFAITGTQFAIQTRNNQTVRNVCMWMQQECGHSEMDCFHVSYHRRMSDTLAM